jgi:hypothetical protein
MSSAFASEVERLLAPVLGEFIAKATVAKSCRAIGTTPDDLAYSHISEFSKQIEGALNALIGSKQADEIVAKIRNIR